MRVINLCLLIYHSATCSSSFLVRRSFLVMFSLFLFSFILFLFLRLLPQVLLFISLLPLTYLLAVRNPTIILYCPPFFSFISYQLLQRNEFGSYYKYINNSYIHMFNRKYNPVRLKSQLAAIQNSVFHVEVLVTLVSLYINR